MTKERSVYQMFAQTLTEVADMREQLDLAMDRLDACCAALRLVAETQAAVRRAAAATSAHPMAAGAFDETIEVMVARGCGDREIGDYLGYAASTVRSRRCAIGLDLLCSRMPWTDEEDAALRGLIPTCTSFREVAQAMGARSETACRKRAQKLGLRFGTKRGRCLRWTRAEDDYLADVWEKGVDIEDIRERLHGRSEAAIRERARRLGLTASHERYAAVRRKEEWA